MSTPAARLAHALRGAVAGEAALPRALTSRLLAELRERGARRTVMVLEAGAEVELTAREAEVFDCLRRREPRAEIAVRLGISEVTVRRHIASALKKLGMPNRRRAIELLEQAARDEPPPEPPAPASTGFGPIEGRRSGSDEPSTRPPASECSIGPPSAAPGTEPSASHVWRTTAPARQPSSPEFMP